MEKTPIFSLSFEYFLYESIKLVYRKLHIIKTARNLDYLVAPNFVRFMPPHCPARLNFFISFMNS